MSTRTTEREQFLADIITTAIEGGTGYWATVLAYRWSDRPPTEVFAVIMPDEDEYHQMLEIGCSNFVSNEGRKPTALELLDYGLTLEPDQEDSEPLLYKIDIDTIAKGISRIVQEEVGVRSDIYASITLGYAENDAGEIDADGADVIVQAALFGKLVYG